MCCYQHLALWNYLCTERAFDYVHGQIQAQRLIRKILVSDQRLRAFSNVVSPFWFPSNTFLLCIKHDSSTKLQTLILFPKQEYKCSVFGLWSDLLLYDAFRWSEQFQSRQVAGGGNWTQQTCQDSVRLPHSLYWEQLSFKALTVYVEVLCDLSVLMYYDDKYLLLFFQPIHLSAHRWDLCVQTVPVGVPRVRNLLTLHIMFASVIAPWTL